MKRFTETDKWEDAWYRALPVRIKVLWGWLCDKCLADGVISPDWETASFQIGETVTEEDLKHFERQIERLPDGKLLILQFIPFQYGKLSRECRPHDRIFELLEKHGITQRYSDNAWIKKPRTHGTHAQPAPAPNAKSAPQDAGPAMSPAQKRYVMGKKIEYLEEQLSKHPGNWESEYCIKGTVSDAEWQDHKARFKAKKAELAKLQEEYYNLPI